MSDRTPIYRRLLDVVWRAGARGGTIALVLVAFGIGYLLSGGEPPHNAHEHEEAAVAEEEAEQWYTCSMHPDVRMPNPDDMCPICNMSLIPVGDMEDDDEDDAELPRLRVSERARALMQVETMPAVRRSAAKELRLFGRVDYDETQTQEVSVLTAGRVERLYLNYVNMPVPRGARVAEIYSPEVLAAAEEMLVAQRVAERRGADSVRSVRRKLELLGVPSGQVDAILESGEVPRTFTLYSPIGGVLTELKGYEGNWLGQGDTVATVSDTSQLWVRLEAYEEDLPWLRYGQEIDFTTAAHPGEVFEGRISYIEPVVTAATRTVRVRATVDNPDGRLKPDMFVRGVVKSELAAGGQVVSAALAGKWISPVHPEIVKDGPGTCDICGTALVPAADFGYAALGADGVEEPVLIPATAPLHTGKRAVVYVEVPGEDRPTFEGRTVVLGPRTNGYYEVKEGIEEGDLVVTHGAFRIDSELQIRGRPSMMARPREEPEDEELAIILEVTEDVDPAAADQIGALVEAYAEVSTALSLDDFDTAAGSIDGVYDAIDNVDADLLDGDAAEAWEQAEGELRGALGMMADAADIDGMRVHFEPLSDWLAAVVDAFGAGAAAPVYLAHCPMAFDNRGADWLQLHEEIENPYFGAEMYRCGEILRELADGEPDPPPDDLDVTADFAEQVDAVWRAYLVTMQALADDDPDAAADGAGAIVEALADADPSLLDERGQDVWGQEHAPLFEAAETVGGSDDIEAMREAFEPLSMAMRRVLLAFHGGQIGPVYVVHCPMAFDDEGADWLDERDEVHNPYFGDMMYSCGEVTETLLETAREAVAEAEVPEAAGQALAPVWEGYQAVSQALADDDEEAARELTESLRGELEALDAPDLPEDLADDWAEKVEAWTAAAEAMLETGDMESLREAFEPFTQAAESLLAAFHGGQLGPIYKVHCPMAFDDEGADWLDSRDEVHNPYFGEMMYACGYVADTLAE